MRWRRWISEEYEKAGRKVRPDFREGATTRLLSTLEAELGLPVPSSLQALLLESNGVFEVFPDEPGAIFFDPVWPCDKILARNKSILRDDPAPQPVPDTPDTKPFYFADAGVDGILFAFLVRPSGAEDPAVYAYYPIENEWRRISPSLEEHLRGWTV